MKWPDGKFLIISLSAHEIYAVENKNGGLIGRLPYAPELTPVALCLHAAGTKACAAFKSASGGALYNIDTASMRGYRLPLQIPAPCQFAASADLSWGCFCTGDATLYRLDLSALTARAFARPEHAACNGIAIDHAQIYAIFETAQGGTLAVFTADGQLHREVNLPAVPTNLCLKDADVLISFTESPLYGEGMAVVPENGAISYLSIQTPRSPFAPGLYPCGITPDPCGQYIYLVHEDGGAISVIDAKDYSVHTTFSVGRSISTLYLLPDPRFGLAGSNMFADLTLLDLVNRRLLSVNDSKQELSSIAAIIS